MCKTVSSLCLLAAILTAVACTEEPASSAPAAAAGGSSAESPAAGGAAGSAGAEAAGSGGASAAPPDLSPVACSACFPLEALSDELRPRAEQLLLAALDHEALYTVFGGIKPMSSGIGGITVPAAEVDGPEVEALRTIAAALRCGGTIETVVHVYEEDAGTRTAELYVVRRPRFGDTVAAHPDVFAPLSVSRDTSLGAALGRIDAEPSTKRFAAYGHLFGYPAHAVAFFVAAEETERAGGDFVARDFVHLPTFSAPTGAFTYAVPKGHVPNEADQALAAEAAPVFNAYSRARGGFTTPIAKKVLGLVRAVFDDGNGLCHPDHASAWIAENGDALPVCAKAGKHCGADADCCSGECHGDHCH